jgi:RND family efflux transporter MFP subunit
MNIFKNDSEASNIKKGLAVRIWGLLPSLVVVLMLLMIILLGTTCSDKKSKLEAAGSEDGGQAQALVNVVALTLTPTTIRDRINLPAVVEPWMELTVMAEVRGKVIQKAVEEGAKVRKGDLIAVIDKRDYVNTYNSAKAMYETAMASYDRYSELYKSELATKSQIDTARSSMENAKASMDIAELSVERCRITAPFEGVLNNVFFEKDQYINTGDPIARLIEIDQVKVNVGIPESDVSSIRRLETFDISFDALDGKTVTGKKVYLSKTTESNARLYSLKLAVDNADGEILPDMFARVEIVKREITDGIAVPVYSVISQNDQNFVYIVGEDDVVSRRSVEIGLQESAMVEVTSGLSPGDRVVVVGHRNVQDGDMVNVTKSYDSLEALQG